MKRLNLCMALLCLLLTPAAFANVFRVNNTLGTDAAQRLFNSIKEAHDAAIVAPGDTLLIEGTNIVHPNITLTKRLVLIGTGYLLTANPQTQYNTVQSVVSQITIKPEAAGSILVGLTFSNSYTNNAPYIEASNVIVMRCFIPNYLRIMDGANNVQIIQNFMQDGGLDNPYTNDKFTNIVLKNNVIGGSLNISSNTTYQRQFAAVENNIFLSHVTLTANSFRNNIIVHNSATVNISSTLVQNNLVSNGQLPAANGNQTYNTAQLFKGATGNSQDGQYKLKDDSPYLTAGYNNAQPGIFGGTMPYVLSGMPAIPSIYELSADGFGSKETGLKVTIKAKTNQ